MWNLRAGGYDTALGLFGEDSWVVDNLISRRYDVEVMKFSSTNGNKFRLWKRGRAYADPRTLLGDFYDVKEFVAVVRLILASETN